jgi:hypothetical protein
MRAVVRLQAFKTLQAAIETAIPELRDHVEIVQVPPEQHMTFPSLSIVPSSPRYVPFQEEEATDDDGNTIEPDEQSLVVSLGAWETTVQLHLACATMAERYALEETLFELWMQREGAPGVLCTTVTACPALGNILASWTLDDSGWQDDKAFSSQHWAMTEVSGVIPVLVTRRGVYSLDDLRLGLTNDFTIPETSAGFDTVVPVVKINEDGTVTRV